MKRRDFVWTLSGVTLAAVAGRAAEQPNDEWIDCNVTVGHWPFRQTLGQKLERFSEHLQSRGVTQVWAASFEAIFRNDLRTENARHSQSCHEDKTSILLPVATINPALPDWREDLLFCQQTLSMKILRLYPNYHGYTLDDACFEELVDFATQRKMSIQLVVQMEDERAQPTRMQVPPVDLGPLAKRLQDYPEARLMLLNATRLQLGPVLQSNQVLFDLAKLEGVGGLEKLLAEVSHEKLVFGSHAPFFYWEAASLKLQESELLDRQLDAILRGNALKWCNG